MTHAREQVRHAPSNRARAEKHDVARAAATGQFVRMQAGDEVVEVPVSKVRFHRIVKRTRAVGKVISGYADAVEKAHKTGQAFIISYRVTPDGQLEAVTAAEKPEALPLDAAIARAKGQRAAKAAEILKGSDMLTARDFGPLIGASHETVNLKRKRHEVLGLEGATRGVRYPRWQVTEAGLPVPGLAKLFEALGAQPWTVYRFLRAAHAELGGRTALDALKAGQVEAVLGVAENQAAGAFS